MGLAQLPARYSTSNEMIRRLAVGLLLLTGQGPVAEPTPGGVPTIVITPDNDERIEKFERRGFDDLQKFRDISAARLWLEVAANHDSMRAARALSDTYNPIWLIGNCSTHPWEKNIFVSMTYETRAIFMP